MKTHMIFKKTVLVALVAALAFAVFPLMSVSASGLNDTADPPEGAKLSDERIENFWARLQRAYERQGRKLDRANERVDTIQDLIDEAGDNGIDVTALQAALDVFEQALKDAHPVYQSANGIINSHPGFNADGQLTDREQAVETLTDLRAKLKQVREITFEPGKLLRETVKAFREANQGTNPTGL